MSRRLQVAAAKKRKKSTKSAASAMTAGEKKTSKAVEQGHHRLGRVLRNLDADVREKILKHSIIIAYCHCQNVVILRDR